MNNLGMNLQMDSMSYRMQSNKALREMEHEKLLVKKAMEKGDMERARIHAEIAIRKKNESNRFLSLSNKMEATGANVQRASNMVDLQQKMRGIVGDLGVVMNNINVDQFSETMGQFDDFSSDLDIASDVMEKGMASIDYSLPDNEIGDLVAQVADENNLNLSEQLRMGHNSALSNPMDQLQREYFVDRQNQYQQKKRANML